MLLWPKWLKRGAIKDSKLYCWSWGLNCISIPLPEPKKNVFLAPGKKSKLYDPDLTELANSLNELFSNFIAKRKKKKNQVLGIMLLEEGLCLCWKHPIRDLDKKSNDEIRAFFKKKKMRDLDSLTAVERKKIFDI